MLLVALYPSMTGMLQSMKASTIWRLFFMLSGSSENSLKVLKDFRPLEAFKTFDWTSIPTIFRMSDRASL